MRDPLQQAQATIREALSLGVPACFTCSFQSEDVALLHLLLQQAPQIPVLFLETGYHFPEVLEYRDRLANEWSLNLHNMEALQSVAEQEAEFGLLYQQNPNECCNRRKVEPLRRGLRPYGVWFTGLRREQSPTRANLQPRETHTFPDGFAMQKFSPLYDWTWKEVTSYLAANDIPELPLYAQGYTSIGCAPCTRKPAEGEHARAGRWGGAKLECGLHTVTQKVESQTGA
jgi:phosphoadenosine phosphosulfate reductase